MILTFEEFLEKATNLPDVSVDKNYKVEKHGYYGYDRKKKGKPAVSIKWYTGGISGGSCWDDGSQDNHYSSTGEEEPNFDDFENLILHFCPNITFVEFRNIRGLIKQNDWTEDEYYGNSTNYSEKYVFLEDIYNWLVEKGHLVETNN